MELSAEAVPASTTKDFTVLPIIYPALPAFPRETTHFIYLRPHKPKYPDPESHRSLFLSNVPVDSTEIHIRSIFADQLQSGRVERVDFDALNPSKRKLPKQDAPAEQGLPGKKRKIHTEQEEINVELPRTWDREIHRSGNSAVVVFVDKPSMSLALRATKKAVETKKRLVWGEGVEESLPPLGSKRYRAHHELQYPSSADIQAVVDTYMTAYAEMETTHSRSLAQQRSEPDEDGFVTVTRGGRVGPARVDEARAKLAELKKKEEAKRNGMGNFYRFQLREKRKQREGELKRKFADDAQAMEQLRRARTDKFTPMA